MACEIHGKKTIVRHQTGNFPNVPIYIDTFISSLLIQESSYIFNSCFWVLGDGRDL